MFLVSVSEPDEIGGKESQEFVESLCLEGTPIFVDEDNCQLEGSLGRMIANVYCGYTEKSVNEVILENNHGTIYDKSAIFQSLLVKIGPKDMTVNL